MKKTGSSSNRITLIIICLAVLAVPVIWYFGMIIAIGIATVAALLCVAYAIKDVMVLNQSLEKKVTENRAKIKNAAMRMQAVLDTVIDGIITIDQDKNIRSFNQAACKIFGYEESEVLGKNIKMLMPEEYQQAHDSYVDKYINTGNAKIIGQGGRLLEAQRKDGTKFPIELGISDVKLNDAIMFVGIVRDVTDREQSQLRLVESELKVRSILDNTVDGIITIDEHGTIETYNKACERIFGYESSEAKGKNIKFLMPSPYHEEHDKYLKNYMNTGQRKVIGVGREVQGKRKDGSLFPIDLSVSEVSIGGKRSFCGLVRDISERKQTEEIKKFVEMLKRSNQELDDFAYIASHDLKEPLRGLFNYSNFLKEDYYDQLDEDGKEMLDRMGYLSQRMEVLIDDLLYFSRLGRQDLAIVETDINEVIEDIKDTMVSTLETDNVVLKIEGTLPHVICDKVRVTEVFRNLITNAVKYSDKSEKVIEIGCHDTLRNNSKMHDHVFYVKDNGVGIDQEFHKDIFRIFKRLNEEDDDAKGNGVGLTFVKKIIDRHKGEIWLESTPGQGTTFYFTLNEGVMDRAA